MNKADELYAGVTKAQEYVNKVGRAQRHFRSGEVGGVSSVLISTEINHQENEGATNYWKDGNFDKYLAKIVSLNFEILSGWALTLMKQDADCELLKEKDKLLARLDEINKLEKVNDQTLARTE